MAQIRYPVGFSEKIIAVFSMNKSHVGTENDKEPKFFPLSKFLCSLFQKHDKLRKLEC